MATIDDSYHDEYWLFVFETNPQQGMAPDLAIFPSQHGPIALTYAEYQALGEAIADLYAQRDGVDTCTLVSISQRTPSFAPIYPAPE